MKAILLGVLLFLVLPLASVHAQPENQTIQQVNNDFPVSVIAVATASGGSARMNLESIVTDPDGTQGPMNGTVTWSNTGMTTNEFENGLDVDGADTVVLRTKAHLFPTMAYLGEESLRTVQSEGGHGEFSLEGVEQGIDILNIAVKSQQSNDIGIYQAVAFIGDPESDPLKVDQITEVNNEQMIRLADINMTEVNQ